MQKKQIGFYGALSLIIANMIGTGVFTTSGYSLASLGDPYYVILLWIVGGLLSLSGAVTYAALGRRFRESGGEYYILKESINPLIGFLAGWVSLFAGFTAPIATAALALQAYSGLKGGYWLVASIIVASGILHGFSVKRGLMFQITSVGLKLLAITIFISFAFSTEVLVIPTDSVKFSGWGSFFLSLIWVSFAFSGWNSALYVTSELKDIDKDLMRSSIVAVSIVSLVYILLNYVFIFFAPLDTISGQAEIGKIVALFIGGKNLESFISLIICIALVTSISSMTMIGPRVYAQMAKDGFFPKIFDYKDKAPIHALALQVFLALIAFSFSSLRDLMTYIGYLLSLSSALTVACALLKKNDLKNIIPLYPLPPVFFLTITSFTVVFLVYKEPLQAAYGSLTLLSGVAFYYFYTKKRNCS